MKRPREVFVVHNTFLELHSKTALQHSPKQAEFNGDEKKKKKKKNKHEKAPNSSSSVILISDSP